VVNPADVFPFPTEIETLSFSGVEFIIRHVSDSNALFDRMLELPDDHPAVKDEQIPYWAEVWPSALGISEYILMRPELFSGKKVLEIGCGLGLPGIVAGKWTDRVVLTDYLKAPLELAIHNWTLNHGTPCKSQLLDWRSEETATAADVILASDIAYERRMFEPLMTAFENWLQSGATVIISEPDRQLAREFFSELHCSNWQSEKTELKIVRKGLTYRIHIHTLLPFRK
jgi:predicted nicotinamide N-methyase